MRKIVFFLFTLGFLVSCKNSGKQQPVDNSVNPKLIEFYEKSDAVLNKPAKPSQIADLLALSGARLMPEKLNDPVNWEKYTNNEIGAAANMGVYLADAIVQYAYDEKKPAYYSALAAKGLAAHIGIGEDIFMGYLIGDRYREEDGQSDSLFFILDSALIRADNSLNSNDRFKILAAMYVGNYIEKQYIMSNIVFEYNVDIPEESKLLILRDMIYLLGNSLNRLDYIIEMIEKAHDGEDGAYLLAELKELKGLHTQAKFTKDELAHLQAKDIFDNEGLKSMHDKIVQIRNYIVTAE